MANDSEALEIDADADDDDTGSEGAADEQPELHWMTEEVTQEQMKKRLHASSMAFDVRKAWDPEVIVMMQCIASQANCPVMFVVALFPALICLAAGPNVRLSAWHEGASGCPDGWKELFNITTFLVSRSGGGKSNVMRIIKDIIKVFV